MTVQHINAYTRKSATARSYSTCSDIQINTEMCTSLHHYLEVDSIRCMFVEAHPSLTMSHGRHFDTCPHHTAHTLLSWLGRGHCRADTPSAPNAVGGSHPALHSWAGWAQWRSPPGCTSSTPCAPTYRGYIIIYTVEDTAWTQHNTVFMPINLSQTVCSLTATYDQVLRVYLISIPNHTGGVQLR